MKPSEHDLMIEKLEVGPLGANCYIVADKATRNAFLIDPGGEPDRIKGALKKEKLNLKFIINTHGHGDHIFGNGYFGVPVYVHSLDKDFLTDPSKNLSGFFGLFMKASKADRLLEDGEKISMGNLEMEIIHTPGHTPGGISIKIDGVVFTGDTLFAGGIGRTDLPGGDEEQLFKSIKDKLFALNDDVIVYPGHGGESTIGREKKTNPFFS